jgi:hypothetical protein
MATTPTEKFVVYRLGHHENPPAIQSLPQGIDVVNLFLLNLSTSSGGTVSFIPQTTPSSGTPFRIRKRSRRTS